MRSGDRLLDLITDLLLSEPISFSLLAYQQIAAEKVEIIKIKVFASNINESVTYTSKKI